MCVFPCVCVYFYGHGELVRELDTCYISQGRHILFMAPKQNEETESRRFVGFVSLNG